MSAPGVTLQEWLWTQQGPPVSPLRGGGFPLWKSRPESVQEVCSGEDQRPQWQRETQTEEVGGPSQGAWGSGGPSGEPAPHARL